MVLDLIFPNRCPFCGRLTGREAKVCGECRSILPLVREPACVSCGKEIIRSGELFCPDCKGNDHYFIKNRSLYRYEGDVKRALQGVKYRRRKTDCYAIGRHMGDEMADYIRTLNIDGIVPIPLSKGRMKERGYNQAAILAKCLSEASNVPLYDDYLVRVKNTLPQKNLSLRERENNVKSAFHIGQKGVQLSSILLVDDIYTTGATLDEAARVLRIDGADRIYSVTASIGRGY